MANVIFDALDAEKLNENVQKKIARHLFIFCNYSPKNDMFGTDGRFLEAVQNLYWLTCDASIVRELVSQMEDCFSKASRKRIRDIIQETGMLRSAISHNHSEKTGNDREKREYSVWIKKHTGLEHLSKPSDYEHPLQVLIGYGDDVIKIMEEFIDNISRRADKNYLVKKWEDLIYKFYQRPTNAVIVKGQVYNCYLIEKTPSPEDDIYSRSVQRTVAIWVEDKLKQPHASRIENWSRLISERPLPGRVVAQLREKIEEEQGALDALAEEIKNSRTKSGGADEQELQAFDYMAFFVKTTLDSIPAETEKRRRESDFSLLPQGVIQEIVSARLISS